MPSYNQNASIKSILGLPSTTNDPGVGAIQGLLMPSQQQTNTNYSSATNTTKQAEALYKLKTESSLEKFSSLTRKVQIKVANGSVVAADAATGSTIVNLGDTNQKNQPANIQAGAGEDKTSEMKVIITQEPEIWDSSTNRNEVVFDAMPSISESRGASYESFTPLHHPGEILKFKSTQARAWSISAKLISRTREEASKNQIMMNIVRSWVMPFYGEGTAQESVTKQYLGAPPPVLTLKAYGPRMIGPVKCVLENYSWDFPNDVDYIPTEDGTPFPVVINISLTMKESWAPSEYSGFDLAAYRRGDMPQAFKKMTFAPGGAAEPATNVTASDTGTEIDTSQETVIEQNDSQARAPVTVMGDVGGAPGTEVPFTESKKSGMPRFTEIMKNTFGF